MKRIQYLSLLIAVFVSSSIYILFRSSSLRFFKWINKFRLLKTVEDFREGTSQLKEMLPNWILYSLPDGLWIFSYTTLILLIWNNTITKINIIWLVVLFTMIVIHELGQLCNIFKGTFDISDLVFYIAFAIVPFVLFKRIIIYRI